MPPFAFSNDFANAARCGRLKRLTAAIPGYDDNRMFQTA